MASFIRTSGFQSSDPVLLGDVEKLTSLIEDRCHEPHAVLGAHPAVFKPRAKLSETAQRAGWQGFVYDLRELPAVAIQQVYPPDGSTGA